MSPRRLHNNKKKSGKSSPRTKKGRELGRRTRRPRGSASSEVHKKLLRGEPVDLKLVAARTIPAEWIKEAVDEGAKINVQYAIISGPLNLKYTNIKKEFSLQDCEIRNAADFSYSTFKQNLILTGSVFAKGANFQAATMQYDAFLDDAKFLACQANFRDIHVQGNLFAHRTVFGEGLIADFNRARFDKSACLQGASFEGEANFTASEIGSSAEFQRVVFKKSVRFEGARITGPAFFQKAEFPADYKTSFKGAQFRHGAFFQQAKFQDKVDFSTVKFDVVARFHQATFAQKANFDASRFTGLANFSSRTEEDLEGAVFHEASFEHTHFEHDVRFDETVFRGNISFREASFHVIYFSESSQAQGENQFRGSVDLRGCTYERIKTDWRSLLMRSDGSSRIDPYDRQPYTQLENVFRAVGHDHDADDVYLERRRVARQRLSERRRVERQRLSPRRAFWYWTGDSLYKYLANYGVRPYRLLFIPLLLLALSTFFFSCPGAVRPKPGPNSAQSAIPKTGNNSTGLTLVNSARLSLRYFLPVEVPLATHWEASDKQYGPLRFSDYATGMKLAGWILVPLGIAALTGLLRRVTP